MDKDQIAGSAKDLAGKIEGTFGGIAGEAKTEAAGRVREATRHGAEHIRPGQGCSARSYGCRRQLRQRRL